MLSYRKDQAEEAPLPPVRGEIDVSGTSDWFSTQSLIRHRPGGGPAARRESARSLHPG